MKRQNRFIIALLAAGITFATLTATMGTEHWKRGYYGRHGYYHHHPDNDGDHNHWWDKEGSEPRSEENNSDSE